MYKWAINPSKFLRASQGTTTEQETLAKYRSLGGKVIESEVPVVEPIVEPVIEPNEPKPTKPVKSAKVKGDK